MPRLKDFVPSFKLGPATVRQNLTVFPLFAEGVAAGAQYTPIGNAIRQGSARITEVSEGGSVPTLALENLTEIPVLIIDGEELIGARQNRISNLSVLAPGKRRLPLPVSCVERGRWSYRTREFAESPDLMYREARAKKSRAVSASMAMHQSRVSDQGQVWADIDALSSKLGFQSPTGAMRDVYESRRTSIDEYLRDVTVADGQVGAVFSINGTAAGVELFDSTETLRTYLPKILRSYALDAIANQTLAAQAAAEEKEASRLLDSILELDAKSFPSIGLGEDLRIDSGNITGGALAQNGRVIHLAAFQTTLPAPQANPGAEGNTRPMVVRNGQIMIRGGNGRVALLDTGSPLSIGRGEAYTVAGKSWNPSTAMVSVLDAACEHAGRRIDWLLGGDFFAANRVVIDWPARRVQVASGPYDPAGTSIPIQLVMGVPVVTAQTANGPVRGIIDSGASLSYVPGHVVEGARPVGKRKDFFPGFGEFETHVWRIPATIGGRSVILSAGVLPPMLQAMFALVLGADGWIIGSDFFRDRVTLIDYQGLRIVV